MKQLNSKWLMMAMLALGLPVAGYAANLILAGQAQAVSGSTPLNNCCNTSSYNPSLPCKDQANPCAVAACEAANGATPSPISAQNSAPGASATGAASGGAGSSGSAAGNTMAAAVAGNSMDNYNTTGKSLIDNMSFNHIHSAWDYKICAEHVGCASCGSSAPRVVPQLLTTEILRLHRYRDVATDSSFGPGLFCNFDTKLYLTTFTNGSTVIDLFDPQSLNTHRFIDGPYAHPFKPNDPKDGHYSSFKTRSHRDLTLFDAQGVPATAQSNAVLARVN